MAALLQLSVTTGTSTVTDNVGGIDLISADNATNTLANRQQYPITVGTRSYEKWIRLKVVTAPSNYVQSFKVWGDGAIDTSTTLWFTGAIITYNTATASASTWANVTFTQYTAGGTKAVWDNSSYSATNAYTKYIVFQLQVGSDAGPGNWTQETVSYSYDEA